MKLFYHSKSFEKCKFWQIICRYNPFNVSNKWIYEFIHYVNLNLIKINFCAIFTWGECRQHGIVLRIRIYTSGNFEILYSVNFSQRSKILLHVSS